MVPTKYQLDRIKLTLLVQFPNLDFTNILGETGVKVSKKTKRIREIYDLSGGKKILLFSLRTNDGRFLPTFEAGKRIISSGYSSNRIVVEDDAAPFVKSGKSAFCRHVLTADDNIRPYSEVFILDSSNNLLAIGTAMQPGYAMLQLQHGIAAKTRSYLK